MKKAFLFIALICGLSLYGYCQQVLKRNYTFKAEVFRINDSLSKLYLADINDTALITTAKQIAFRSKPDLQTTPIMYYEVKSITLQRKGAPGRGAAIGIIVGSIVGGIIGAITYQPCEGACFLDFGVGFDMLAGASIGTLTGGLTGLIIGLSSKKRFKVNGDRQQFEKMKLTVIDMAYKNSPRQ